MNESEIKSYFENETDGFVLTKIQFIEEKNSYLFATKCYLIETDKKFNFYLFDSDTIPINLYPVCDNLSLEMHYYMHIGLMSELISRSVSNNFILSFIDTHSIFQILDRRLYEIESEIKLEQNANQLSGIANQIRDCYVTLSNYLMNRIRTNNTNFKHDAFIANLEEFLKLILPGTSSETRRNTINGVAQKGWKLNSELIHKDSITIFDIMISLNILKLIISIINNLITGNDMPFNKVKCPKCESEDYTILKNSTTVEYNCICELCKTNYYFSLDDVIKSFPLSN